MGWEETWGWGGCRGYGGCGGGGVVRYLRELLGAKWLMGRRQAISHLFYSQSLCFFSPSFMCSNDQSPNCFVKFI